MPLPACVVMLLALLLLAAPGCAPGLDGEPTAQLILASVGRDTFQQYCASCHGAGGRGDGPVAASLRTPPADLTRIAARRGGAFPEAEIAEWIDGRLTPLAHGAREMPVWGQRFQEQIARDTGPDEIVRGRLAVLIEYLKTIQQD